MIFTRGADVIYLDVICSYGVVIFLIRIGSCRKRIPDNIEISSCRWATHRVWSPSLTIRYPSSHYGPTFLQSDFEDLTRPTEVRVWRVRDLMSARVFYFFQKTLQTSQLEIDTDNGRSKSMDVFIVLSSTEKDELVFKLSYFLTRLILIWRYSSHYALEDVSWRLRLCRFSRSVFFFP